MSPHFLQKQYKLSISITLVLSVPLTLQMLPARADESVSDESKKHTQDNSVFELGEMVITGTPSGKLESRDILSSVDIMNADKIENQNVLRVSLNKRH
jgi:hypothetical protein